MNTFFKPKEKLSGQIVMLGTSELVPNKAQPRREFSEEALLSLAKSIKENGILQPICVRKVGAVYEIISGERRTRAAKIAGLHEVPCIVMSVDDEQSAVLALIENIQRKDLSYFEEALGIEKLISYYGLTQEEAARRLGKAQSTVANKLRLLRFGDAERRLLLMGNLSERQARAIIRIDDPQTRISVIEKVVARNLNLDQTEQLVEETLGTAEKPVKRRAQIDLKAPSRLYMNSLNALLKRIKADKIPCDVTAEKSDCYYEYVIRFPIDL
ncbi:MAG: ParB/RepB/Spo0J family partition protein [Oscillospiraceae bacterium]|nr:ParB/RepB/Spo0J family partition protein [Oscillospiraceae bacterium]